MANVHPKVVSERLGHAGIEIMLNTMQTSAVAAMSDVLVAVESQEWIAERNRPGGLKG